MARRLRRSKKRRFAFQTFTETPTTTPSTLGFGISHQPHGRGDGAKCGAKFADTPHVIYKEVTSASEMRKETGKHLCWLAFPAQYQRLTSPRLCAPRPQKPRCAVHGQPNLVAMHEPDKCAIPPQDKAQSHFPIDSASELK